MNYIKGKFRNIIYESNTGYRVGIFKVVETDIKEIKTKSITYTGTFSELEEDSLYKLYGEYIYHDRYGYQFSVSSYEKVIPEDKDAIIEFLTSSFVKGCGESTALKIYELYGNLSIVKIKEDINNLMVVPKMNQRKAQSIYNSVCKYFEKDEQIMKLKDYGFSIKETFSLYNKFGDMIFNIIDKNIYQLKDEIDFKKLDQIFINSHELTDERRVRACILETIKKVTFDSGDIYLYKDEIVSNIMKYFVIDIDITNDLLYLFNYHEIMIKDDKYYLMSDYLDEDVIASSVKYLNKKGKTIKNFDKVISEVQSSIEYNKEQKDAIKMALENNITIITGGPGTGKTTIVKGIINTYAKINNLVGNGIRDNILLLAPTGRAAKRIFDTTGIPASTIHRFLKWDKENNVFGVNELSQEHYNLIIVDETSMIDNHLLASLFNGLDLKNSQMIFVGDEYQLPSVSPGNVLQDLINTDIPHIKLEKIYRQSENSFIPLLASNIKDVTMSEDLFVKKDDFSFLICDNLNIKKTILIILEKMREKGINENNMQILAPMYKSENGIDNLNILAQEFFNPQDGYKDEINIGPVKYRVNDKILNLVNDLEKNIYNGDIGYIKSINKESKSEYIIASFDGKIVNYKKEELEYITHAYAISIHKSQGSEFDHVIMPICSSFNRMLYNKLLYTGVSRAKKSLIIIGSFDSFNKSVLNNYSYQRKTTLKEKIENNQKKITHNNVEV